MKDIEIDELGQQRCWNCGGKNFTEQRTTRAKVAFGVGALLTKKKLRCVRCGEYNDVGSAKAFRGPADRKYRAEWQAEQARSGSFPVPPAPPPTLATAPPPGSSAEPDGIEQLKKLGELRDAGILTEEEFAAKKADLLGRL